MVVTTPVISPAETAVLLTVKDDDVKSLTAIPALNDVLKFDAVIKAASPGGNISARVAAASLAILLMISIKVSRFILFPVGHVLSTCLRQACRSP